LGQSQDVQATATSPFLNVFNPQCTDSNVNADDQIEMKLFVLLRDSEAQMVRGFRHRL